MATPNLGYDKTGETTLDAFNQWFRKQPQYFAKLAEMGQDPNNVHLNDQQKQDMVRLAQSMGAVVDEGNSGQEVDDSGNFRNKSHKLRNGLIIGGIAGAALLTAGLAGAFSGAAGVGGGAAGATGATSAAGSGLAGLAGASGAGTLASTTIGTGFIPAIAGGTGLAGSAAAAGGGVAGALGVGSKIASLASGVGKLVNGVNTVANNGQDPNLEGIGAANAAAQAAKNRIAGAQTDQLGTAADTRALANMRTAGLMSNFKDTEASPYGSPAIVLGDKTRQLSSKFQDELLARQAMGKSLTANGVPDPGAQELSDEEKARQIAGGSTGNPTLDKLNTGLRLAQLAPGALKLGQDIWRSF